MIAHAVVSEAARDLALGTAALLGAGVLLGLRCAEVHRQRAAEAAIAACLLFTLLALLPLPRPLALRPGSDSPPRTPAAAVLPVAVRPVAATTAPAVPTVAAAPAAGATVPWWLAAYLGGSGACVLWLLLGQWRVHRVLRVGRPAPPELHALARTGDRAPRVLVSPRAGRPFCCRALRPTIVLPEAATPPALLAHVLRHEAVHIARRDLWSQALFALALPLLWPQPLFWWLRRRARLAAELIADSVAARGARTQYARALLDLSAQEHGAVVPAGVLPVFRHRSDLTRRLEMLFARSRPLHSRLSPTHRLVHLLGAALSCTVVAATFGLPAAAQDPGDPGAAARERDRLAKEVAELRQHVADLKREVIESARTGDRPAAGQDEPGLLDRLLADRTFLRRVAEEMRTPSSPVAAKTARRQDPVADGERVTVRAGDTIGELLRRSGRDPSPAGLADVLERNPGLEPSRLRVGQDILLPPPRNPLTLARRASRDGAGQEPHPAPGDALDIVLRLIDAQTAAQHAKARLEDVGRLVASDGVRKQEQREAELALRAAQRRVEVVERALQAEIDLAATEVGLQEERFLETSRLHEAGFASKGELAARKAAVHRARTRLDVLHSGSR